MYFKDKSSFHQSLTGFCFENHYYESGKDTLLLFSGSYFNSPISVLLFNLVKLIFLDHFTEISLELKITNSFEELFIWSTNLYTNLTPFFGV